MSKQKGCINCAWAVWPRTKTGRIVRDSMGDCTVRLPAAVLPVSVTEAYGYRLPLVGLVNQLQGDNCPLYQEGNSK